MIRQVKCGSLGPFDVLVAKRGITNNNNVAQVLIMAYNRDREKGEKLSHCSDCQGRIFEQKSEDDLHTKLNYNLDISSKGHTSKIEWLWIRQYSVLPHQRETRTPSGININNLHEYKFLSLF